MWDTRPSRCTPAVWMIRADIVPFLSPGPVARRAGVVLVFTVLPGQATAGRRAAGYGAARLGRFVPVANEAVQSRQRKSSSHPASSLRSATRKRPRLRCSLA